jgi:hypothetical protein
MRPDADDRPLVRNAADQRQVQHSTRKSADREDTLLAALRIVLSEAAGRLVLATLLEEGGIYRTSFDVSGPVMNFREGQRASALRLLDRIVQADDALYDLMEKERRQRHRADNRETEAVQERGRG